jgi:hypothetical protein
MEAHVSRNRQKLNTSVATRKENSRFFDRSALWSSQIPALPLHRNDLEVRRRLKIKSIQPLFACCDWVRGQNRGKRIGSVEDFIRQGKQTAKGTLAPAFFVIRRGPRWIREVLMPASDIAVELAKAAMPAVRFKLADEFDAPLEQWASVPITKASKETPMTPQTQQDHPK